MKLQSVSGLVICSGFVLYVLAMLAAPRLYQEADIANRVAIVAANRTRWNISQLLFALGAGVPAAGFLLLAVSQRGTQNSWLYFLGAAAFAAGSAVAMWLVYRQTLDPAAFWEGQETPLIVGYGFLLLTSVGMLCLGIALQQGHFPDWIGYLMAGSALVILAATFILRGAGGFYLSILAYLVTFVAGIIIWRQ